MFKINDTVIKKDDGSKLLIVTRVWGDAITCMDVYNDKKSIYLYAEQLLLWPIVATEIDVNEGAK